MSEIYSTTCPICSASISLWNTKKTDAGEFNLDRCRDCSYVFVNPRPSLEYLVDFYSVDAHAYDRQEEDAMSLDQILQREADWPNSTADAERIVGTAYSMVELEHIISKPSLFDVACGTGFFTREALKLGFEVTALEISSSDRKIATEMNGLEPQSIPFEEFNAADDSFDVIILSQIVEHVLDINDWVSKSQKLLKPNGILVIALPNFDNLFRFILGTNEPYIIPPEHLNYFSARNLRKLMSKHNLNVEKIEWTSNVLPSAIAKLPFGKVAMPVLKPLVGISLKFIDLLRLGIFVTVYVRKT